MKWELVETKNMVRETYNAWWGNIRKDVVLCDIYRRKRWNGTYKYKIVPRW